MTYVVREPHPRTLVIVSSLLLAAGLASCSMPIWRALAIERPSSIESESEGPERRRLSRHSDRSASIGSTDEARRAGL